MIRASRSSRDELLRQYTPLVHRIAHNMYRKLPHHLIDQDDLIQAGMIGLLQAIDRHEDEQYFKTFAHIRIHGAMIDEIRTEAWRMRTQVQAMQRINRARIKLEQSLGREPQASEMATELGLSLAEYNKMACLAAVELLDTQLHDSTSEDELGDFEREFADTRDTPQEAVEKKNLLEMLEGLIAQLPPREQLVMHLYYADEKTLREIGEQMGISESRVCQLRGQAIARMKHALGG